MTDSSEDISTPELREDLTGRVALVTGASRGIGRRIAADLAALGATVYGTARDAADVTVSAADGDPGAGWAADAVPGDRDATGADAPDGDADGDTGGDGAGATGDAGEGSRRRAVPTPGPAPDAPDGEVRPLSLDVTDAGAVERVVDRVTGEAGRLDSLVNNAGVMDDRAPLHETPVETIDATYDVNLRGPTLLTRAALPALLEAAGGHVVTLTSGLGRLSRMGGSSAAYRVSKVGVNGLTAYLDAEYGDRGLLANAVSPGWVRTDMGGESAPRSVARGADTPVWLCRFRPGSPAGRLWYDRAVVEW